MQKNYLPIHKRNKSYLKVILHSYHNNNLFPSIFLQMQAINPGCQVRLQLTPVSNQHYAFDIEQQFSEEYMTELKRYQYIMIVLECRSGLETEHFRSLKLSILNLIFDLKEKHVKEIGLFWNDTVLEVGTLPNKQISEFIDGIVQETKKGEEEFSYTDTLMSLRHKISNIKTELTNRYELTILFLSTQLALSETLLDVSWQQQYMKWLYGKNKHKEDISKESERLRLKLRSLPCKNTVMSIGFGKYHDSDILFRMSQLSSIKGHYISTESVKELNDALDTFSTIGSGELLSLNLSVMLSNKEWAYFVIEPDEKYRVYRRKQGKEFIDKQDAVDLINLEQMYEVKGRVFGVDIQNFDVKIVENMVESFEEEVDLNLYYIDFLLLKIIKGAKDILVIQREKDLTNENKYIYVQYFDQDKMERLVKQKQNIDLLFEEVNNKIKSLKMGKKSELIDRTNTIRDLILRVQQVFANIYKKKFSYIDIAQLIGETSKLQLKRSLKKKLLKRINANPSLLGDAYKSIKESLNTMSYVNVDAKYSHYLKEVGNCKYTGDNFVTSMFNEDCLAVAYTIHRPKAAIADPGRIKIKQVFHYPVSAGNYINDYNMRNSVMRFTYDGGRQCFLNRQLGLRYKVDGDTVIYLDEPGYSYDCSIVESEAGYNQFAAEKVGILPLYICEENWKIARELMKPALGWTVCDEPLAYTASQMQIVPFLVLEGFITEGQNLKYSLDELDGKIQKFFEMKGKFEVLEKALDGVADKQDISPENKEILLTYYSENKFNRLKLKQIRADIRNNLKQHNEESFKIKEIAYNQIKSMMRINEKYLKLVEETCQKIITQFSGPHAELPFNQEIVNRYTNYVKPINRTVDVIPNNFAFIAQLYCVIRSEFFQKPNEQEFHYFFQRLVEQELRRQTDEWKEEYVEQSFINKLLNVEIEKIDHPVIVAMGSTYRDKFEAATKGVSLKMNQIHQKTQAIQLNIRKDNTFNVVQRMSLIEYKRLYESTALKLWYTRFRLYNQVQRILIHKWKSIGILNAFNMFTLIIQNKTQRKNIKRRETILAGEYVDPFDYEPCVDFIQSTFHNLRQKVIRRNVQATVAKIFNNDVETFVLTADPVEAAGVLLDNTIGRKIAKFYDGLMHKDGPLVHVKLNMIFTGYYQDVQLFTHVQGWDMSRQKIKRLNQKYPEVFEKYKWMI